MGRSNKPYTRPDPQQRRSGSDPDSPWKHDLHESVKQSLASRISSKARGPSGSSSRPSLLDRISGGQGKELLSSSSSSSSKLHGFDSKPPVNPTNPNAGLELFPAGRGPRKAGPLKGVLEPGQRNLVSSGLDAALGRNQPRITPRPYAGQGVELLSPPLTGATSSSVFGFGGSSRPSNGTASGNGVAVGSVSIMGAARGTVWVRVENLAQGTTADDVVSAFAPSPILNSRQTSPADALTVTVELELASRANADELVQRYHGAVADGNALSVTVIRLGLVERMQSQAKSAPVTKKDAYAGQELVSRGPSKMYSDTILATNPAAAIITLADQEAMQQTRAAAWSSDARQRGSLASRMGLASGTGKSRGRGQIGGGSFASMMVD